MLVLRRHVASAIKRGVSRAITTKPLWKPNAAPGRDMTTTLVCGVGGITGNTVLSVLSARGFTTRALVHREERTQAAVKLGAKSVVIADYDDPASLTSALRGVNSIFFVAASYQEREPLWVSAIVAAAEEAGVERFVYQSVLHPYTPSMPHHARKALSEVEVRASRLEWTILQPTMYAQTVLRVRERSLPQQINAPYDPDTRFAVIDVRDLAECAAEVLSSSDYVYGGYELVGTEVQSFRQMVATMNTATGETREIIQVEPTDRPLPPSWGPRQVEEYALMCGEYSANGLLGSTTTATSLLRRRPTSFADVVEREL